VKKQHDAIPSEQIIKYILEAEKFQLLKYLNECIDVASRKKHKNLVDNPMFEEISQETRLKISCKRWSDVDFVIDFVDDESVLWIWKQGVKYFKRSST
jgi:hypothetical protein